MRSLKFIIVGCALLLLSAVSAFFLLPSSGDRDTTIEPKPRLAAAPEGPHAQDVRYGLRTEFRMSAEWSANLDHVEKRMSLTIPMTDQSGLQAGLVQLGCYYGSVPNIFLVVGFNRGFSHGRAASVKFVQDDDRTPLTAKWIHTDDGTDFVVTTAYKMQTPENDNEVYLLKNVFRRLHASKAFTMELGAHTLSVAAPAVITSKAADASERVVAFCLDNT
jgi:hypothetical protein